MCLAIPGKIVEMKDDDPIIRLGTVDFGGVFKEAFEGLSADPEAQIGCMVNSSKLLSIETHFDRITCPSAVVKTTIQARLSEGAGLKKQISRPKLKEISNNRMTGHGKIMPLTAVMAPEMHLSIWDWPLNYIWIMEFGIEKSGERTLCAF